MGATFAYFSVTGTDNSSTTVTGQTPSVGTVALTSGTSLTLKPTAEQMDKSNQSKSYYATTSETVATSEQENTLATLKLTGGTEGQTYACTATVDVTVSGQMANQLTDKDAFINLKTSNGTTIGDSDYEFDGDIPVAISKIVKDSANYKGLQVAFSLTSGTDTATIKGDVWLVNTENVQNSGSNDISGKDLTVTVAVNGLDCHVTE